MASFRKPVKSVHDAAKPITRFEFVLAKSQKNFTVYRFKANYYQQRTFFALVFFYNWPVILLAFEQFIENLLSYVPNSAF